MDSPPGGQHQAVAIFQSVSLDRNVLIMDGPTAVLAVASVEALLESSWTIVKLLAGWVVR